MYKMDIYWYDLCIKLIDNFLLFIQIEYIAFAFDKAFLQFDFQIQNGIYNIKVCIKYNVQSINNLFQIILNECI